MKNLVSLVSLLLLPNFSPVHAEPAPPEVGTDTVERGGEKPQTDKDDYPSNVGAVNEGGGSANTNGMNSGLSPNASGSGTNNARAGDTSGFSFGEGAKKDQGTGEVNPAQER